MSRPFVLILVIALFAAVDAKSQFESDSIFTWKHQIADDITTQANIKFIPQANITVTSWLFGDGSSSTEQSPLVLFPYSQSTDSMAITMNYIEGAESKSYTRNIPLSPAYFWIQLDTELQSLADLKRIFVSAFCLENTVESIGNLRFSWTVDGAALEGHYFTNSALGQWPNVYHSFLEGGEHVVGLSVYNINSQSDVATFVQSISLDEVVLNQKLENIPNVFTPNSDGVNDYFEIKSSGTSWFVIRIFSRTGALIFQDEASIIQWDGRNIQGKLLPDGVYFYVIEDRNKVYESANGFVYLFGEKQ